MKKLSLIISILMISVLISCKSDNKKDNVDNKQAQDSLSVDDEKENTKTQITLTKLDDFAKYDNVKLSLEKPEEKDLEPGKINFKFKVNNFKLGEQTDDAEQLGIANSDEGQHIHFIIDNEPYMAFYEDDFNKELDEGVHTLVAFPARSYHMSIKDKNAYVAKKIKVGHTDNDQFKDVDFSEPTLIYSRPKGAYKGDDTKKILLDFYLLNTDLGESSNKIKATINGEDFIIDQWAPYIIEGLPMGKSTIKLQLIDKNNNPVKGQFNTTEREITLEK